MTLFLVRHGRPLVEPGLPAATWSLDPAGYDDVWALRESGRLPGRAAWFASPEPKATETAQLLTDQEVGVVDALREHERTAGWVDDFDDAVRRAFDRPEEPAEPGWEPLARCRDRVVGAATSILGDHREGDVVMVGHGTAWTLLAAHLSGEQPDLERWAALAMPDLLVIDG